MPNASVHGFAVITIDGKSTSIDLPRPPYLSNAALAISGTAAHTAALPAGVAFVRIRVPVVCHVAVGVDAVATADDPVMSPGHTEYWGVIEGAGMRVSVLLGDDS